MKNSEKPWNLCISREYKQIHVTWMCLYFPFMYRFLRFFWVFHFLFQEAVEADGPEACILKMCWTGNLYNWPDNEDQCWQDVNDIIFDMPQPVMDNIDYLTFHEKSLKEAEKKSMQWEFVTFVHFKWFRICFCSLWKYHFQK